MLLLMLFIECVLVLITPLEGLARADADVCRLVHGGLHGTTAGYGYVNGDEAWARTL